jgi:hypothetical protein
MSTTPSSLAIGSMGGPDPAAALVVRPFDPVEANGRGQTIAIADAFKDSQIFAAPQATVSTGAQAIGLANWDAKDVQILARDCAAAGGNCAVAFLPFEFNSQHGFDNATLLAQSLLPKLNGSLQLTAHLYFHRWEAAFQWDAFTAAHLTAGQQAFQKEYLARVHTFDLWARDLTNWASSKGLAGKLSIVLSPYLEDDCPDVQTYEKVLAKIAAQQTADHVLTGFRRSVGVNFFRPTDVPIELHDSDDHALADHLRPGDVYSNDGFGINLNDSRAVARFIDTQRQLLQKGITVLYWSGSFNVGSYSATTPPSQRKDLKPLENALENAVLALVLASRKR